MRKYTVGINVTHVDELTDMAPKVKSFLDVLGDGDLDLQLAINPRGDDHGFVANVIGFVPDDSEYDEEEDYEEYDDEETEEDE